jgi:preprotein translocase SecE subunit
VKNFYIQLLLWSVGILAIFGVAWYLGWLKSLAVYIGETRDELKKCNWPSKDELWNSTVLVFVVLAALGLFTIGSDFAILKAVRALL